MSGRVKHWSEYDRPAWAGPAPDLWDAVSAHGHILGPFATREEAQARLVRKPTVRWLADRDGIAHAIAGRAVWTVCDKVPVREQLAWPATSRCGLCERRLRAVA